ncbi:MAG: PilZ domain-containing protein [Sphingomicrobium sp.]|nr:PilZ domain-containing protein [Sphingomonadales bacterium]
MSQNRRARRSNVLMSASIELSGVSLPVKLRNLSSDGALIEGEGLPVEGAELLFRKAELSLPGRIAWVEGNRAGIAFAESLCPEAVLRHVPTPRPRVRPEFRRPGLGACQLTDQERLFGETWVWRPLERG